jgi:hypothetical protein
MQFGCIRAQQTAHVEKGAHDVSFAQSIVAALRVHADPIPLIAWVVRQFVQAMLTWLGMVAMQSAAVHIPMQAAPASLQPHSLSRYSSNFRKAAMWLLMHVVLQLPPSVLPLVDDVVLAAVLAAVLAVCPPWPVVVADPPVPVEPPPPQAMMMAGAARAGNRRKMRWVRVMNESFRHAQEWKKWYARALDHLRASPGVGVNVSTVSQDAAW